jgi:hypothetical protein
VLEPNRVSTECKEMEEAQNDSSLENEAKGMDVHLGFEGSNSNGHGEEIDKEGHMMKIIERLQKDAQTHREDNRNLMKAKEQQGEFNLNLMKSLDRIENKLDKERDSRKTGSHIIMREEDQGLLVDTIITPKVSPRGGHTIVQSHILPESTRYLEWMN